MNNSTFELLVKSKNSNAVKAYYTSDKADVTTKAKDCASKGFPVVVISRENGTKKAAMSGPKADWKQFRRIVEVSFGGKDDCYTYTCDSLWEVGDSRFVQTPKGVKMAVVKTAAHMVHVSAVMAKEAEIGYSLKQFEKVVIK